jgi:hypothetical protein
MTGELFSFVFVSLVNHVGFITIELGVLQNKDKEIFTVKPGDFAKRF